MSSVDWNDVLVNAKHTTALRATSDTTMFLLDHFSYTQCWLSIRTGVPHRHGWLLILISQIRYNRISALAQPTISYESSLLVKF